MKRACIEQRKRSIACKQINWNQRKGLCKCSKYEKERPWTKVMQCKTVVEIGTPPECCKLLRNCEIIVALANSNHLNNNWLSPYLFKRDLIIFSPEHDPHWQNHWSAKHFWQNPEKNIGTMAVPLWNECTYTHKGSITKWFKPKLLVGGTANYDQFFDQNRYMPVLPI